METVYQWYAELEDYRPRMWRRFQTSDTVTVARLGYIVMTLFEMQADHLLAIRHERSLLTPSGKKSKKTEQIGCYEIPSEYNEMAGWDNDSEDATAVQVSSLALDDFSSLIVLYDFGDGWSVKLTLEKKPGDSAPPDNLLQGNLLPRVLEGAGFGIIEDSGGPFGLEDMVNAFKQKKGDAYEEYREWLGTDDLDLEKFDVDDMNFRLKKLPDIFAKIYEKRRMPTAAEYKFIGRKYLESPKKRGKKAD